MSTLLDSSVIFHEGYIIGKYIIINHIHIGSDKGLARMMRIITANTISFIFKCWRWQIAASRS